MTKVITAKDWPREIAKRIKADNQLLRKASLGAVQRGLADAAQRTVVLNLVDRGTFLRDWEAGPTEDGAFLRNGAPYAGVLEYGRRPGAPGPPFQPIFEWVQRKLVGNNEVEPEDAEGVAWAIRNHIHEHGTPPHFILRDVSGKLVGYLRDEALRLLRRK